MKETTKRLRHQFNQKKKTNRTINWRKRQIVIQSGKCAFCKCSLKGKPWVIAHLYPICRSKSERVNRPSNWVLSCWNCNQKIGIDIVERPKWVEERKQKYKNVKAPEMMKKYHLMRKMGLI